MDNHGTRQQDPDGVRIVDSTVYGLLTRWLYRMVIVSMLAALSIGANVAIVSSYQGTTFSSSIFFQSQKISFNLTTNDENISSIADDPRIRYRQMNMKAKNKTPIHSAEIYTAITEKDSRQSSWLPSLEWINACVDDQWFLVHSITLECPSLETVSNCVKTAMKEKKDLNHSLLCT